MINNTFELQEHAESLAEMIVNEYDLDTVDIFDAVSEVCDGDENVIYTYSAGNIVQNCDVTEGKSFVADCYPTGYLDYDKQVSLIVYGELCYRVQNALDKMLDEMAA
jgi:hypothetical protein